MTAATEQAQDPNAVNLTINGVPLKARRGDMIIEVADAAGIDIPRFCYHKKLSIAANCRMCLIEVEKVPKPLPACATPVAEGMKIFTRSPKAIEAQKGTMEFLLINHPLDCPICDQGGECELQEMSIGYGSDRSEYAEAKRVVRDKDIGPLIETEMTRCIHCTRCVRFGDEIAGLRELGATGRGENMRIGTYIEKAVGSELSGNVIDLCPVGALTSKPFRYTARAWEMQRRPSIAPHDGVGSNLMLLTRGHKVMRADPRENEAVNECWIADRDRYSYQALNSPERLLRPMVKRDGRWRETDWNDALSFACDRLRQVMEAHGPDALGALVAPGATLEEMYLAQRLARGLGSHNVDHRLRQVDFRDQEFAPVFPWLGQPLVELENVDAALLVGANPRKEQPLVAHRLRKAALRGAAVMCVNPVAWDFNFPLEANLAAGPAGMERHLAAIAAALFEQTGKPAPAELARLLEACPAQYAHRAIARRLLDARRGTVLLGMTAFMHPAYASLHALARAVAEGAGLTLGYLSEGANAAGAWLAGAVPHREAAGARAVKPGMAAYHMFAERLKAFLLLGVEPEYDAAAPVAATAALGAADCVVALSAFKSPAMLEYADVLLPVAPFSETSGTFVNGEGRWQSFAAAVAPAGEARPGWKVLRVLGNLFDLDGFDYMSSEDVREELRQQVGDLAPSNRVSGGFAPPPVDVDPMLTRVGYVPIYAVDPLVRRADALQQTADARGLAVASLCAETADRLGLRAGQSARFRQDGGEAELPVAIDDRVPAGCVLIPAALPETAGLGAAFGPLALVAGRG
ncbi:MAG: NADH-quinone oxidoreductase subunit G [Gammaproteobacteria bacterium]|nr:NADH-quinone oxidoreductase subunit G [Gammaproteobacteria bacterium]